MSSRIKVVRVYSCYADGLARVPVELEISLSPGLPSFDVIGLIDSTIRESRGRIRSALISSGFNMPKGHIVVSISPSYLHKGGSAFDLPAALGILMVSDQLPRIEGKKIYAEGELTLTGELRGTPGASLRLKETRDYDYAFAPVEEATAASCAMFRGLLAGTLKDVADAVRYGTYQANDYVDQHTLSEQAEDDFIDISCLKGQSKAVRAVTIAAAGWHNIMILGSPGCGKTMIGKMIRGLMPPLNSSEASDLYTIYEAMGASDDLPPGIRPYRYVHPGISKTELIGSASNLRPGEVSLADHGILFADEICEFKSEILDSLRIPMEEKQVNLIKDGRKYVFPSAFLFVGAGNPCRCGMFYEENGKCRCTPAVRERYMSKVSGPFKDRIDLFTEMRSISTNALKTISMEKDQNMSREYSEIISNAWQIQAERYGNTGISFNGLYNMADSELLRADKGVIEFASEVAGSLTSSPRGYCKLLRVGRTIADLDGRRDMRKSDISEASVYRRRF